MTVNFNEASEESRQDHHSGARDFVFWNLPQVGKADLQHLKNPVLRSSTRIQMFKSLLSRI